MIKTIKEWFKKRDLEFGILDDKLTLILKKLPAKYSEDLLALMRHRLGSIDLSDLDKKDMTEQERKDYCAAISAVFPRIEKDVKMFLNTQLHFSANEAETWEQTIFGRGTYNGIDLLYEHWKKAHEEHLERSKSPEDFDKHSPIAEID